MADKIDLITEHFILPDNNCIRRFRKRANSSWTIDDIKEYLEGSIKPELGLHTTMRPVIEIEKKKNGEKSSFYNFDDQYIQDYNPFGNKTIQETKEDVFLRVTWSICSQGVNDLVITEHNSSTDSLEQTVSNESDPNNETISINSVEQDSSSSVPKVPQSLSNILKRKRKRNIESKTKRTITNRNNKKKLLPMNIASLELHFAENGPTIMLTLNTYNSANIPLITNFDSNNILRFFRDIDKHQRVEYISNIKPIQQQTNQASSSNATKAAKKFRNLVPIQREKTDKIDQFQRALPILKIPDRCIPKSVDQSEILCVVIVREYEINNEEIGYNVVGNRRLTMNPNPDNEDLKEYFLEILTKDNVKGNLHELLLYMMQLPGEISKKIGPALFKIARQSGETVDIGFKVGDSIGSYRLAIFSLQINDDNLLVPDFATLCLSDYFHQN